jgi:hydroxylamine reductase
MFCYQCEQTAKGTGCNVFGVCGKSPEVSDLQDMLYHATKGISMYAYRASKLGKQDEEIDVFMLESLFTTVTNVNFDPERLQGLLDRAYDILNKAKKLYEDACAVKAMTPETLTGPATWKPVSSLKELEEESKKYSLDHDIERLGEVKAGLYHLIYYGLKGAAAYADHAHVLGVTDKEVYAEFHEIMNFLSEDNHDENELLGMALKTGELNVKVMEMLDRANTSTYGHPEPTHVRVTPIKGKSILVSGHDLKDLEALLKQTEGKGINIYTHGEMLPCNAYPELKKYSHLVGNYGGAWQDQQKEFDEFPGAVLMTTNCIQKPKETYKKRIFTTGLVAWPGVTHVEREDFSEVINAALEAPGFSEDAPEKRIWIGFARNAVLGVADKVIEAVKSGDIKHFFLVGGCDGAKSGRNYYTEFAQKVPENCIILTLACGKYRFNKLEYGDIGGIPRLLDMGQCNDAYSAVKEFQNTQFIL